MVSIVMAYYNRKQLFIETLKSISKSTYKDIEVIAVDDASEEKERIEDLMMKFSFLKVIRLEKENKWYHNSCIPNNVGIAKASGDIIMIQNPEYYHVHDVLDHIMETVTDFNYVSMSAYSIDEEHTKIFMSTKNKKAFFDTFPQQHVKEYMGWYNHSIYNKTYFHFCVALTRKNIKNLGGFDERFAYGIGYEDDDLINRVKRLGLEMIISDNVSVIHQWHPKVYNIDIPEHYAIWDRNAVLYPQVKNETIVTVKNSYYE